MKLHYYMMSLALAATAMVGFTACHDDDTYDDVYIVGGDNQGNIEFTEADVRVKIGEDNRVAIPVNPETPAIKAYSLDPEIATIVYVNDVPMIEGLKNGSTRIMVSDGNGNFSPLVVSVYTTETMTLNHSNLFVTGVVNKTVAVTGIAVELGNGGYSVQSDDSRVNAFIDSESGALAINCAVEEDAYQAVVTVSDQSLLSANVTVSVEGVKHSVKIGESTREEIPVDASAGPAEVNVVSNGTAELVTTGGKNYIEGLANGTAVVTIAQGDNYYFYTYSVYTTDVLTLTSATLNMTTPLGISASNNTVSVALGNDGYSIQSNNADVTARISAAGVITVTATSRMQPYSATLTISDCTGLSATLQVTVTASMEAFTDEEIVNIKAINKGTLFGQVKDPSDGTEPYYFFYSEWNYGTWYYQPDGDVRTFGWWLEMYGTNYGGLKIEVPATAQLNEEVTGKLYYQYSVSTWYPTYTYDGKAKIIYEDDSKVATIFWQIDDVNERINRGYTVVMK